MLMFGNLHRRKRRSHGTSCGASAVLEQARQTQKHIADLFGLEQQDVGLWLGVDKLCAAPSHYPLGPAAGVHTMMKGIATRLEELAALSCGGSLLDESPVGSGQ